MSARRLYFAAVVSFILSNSSSNMKRRIFLGLTATTTGAVLLPQRVLTKNSSAAHKPTRVIVLGAGFAGLAAALKLHDEKVDFCVLESRGRVGGRVFTHLIDTAQDLRVELGAEWVGESHQEIQKLCQRFDIELFNNQLKTDLSFRGEYKKTEQWGFTQDWKKKLDGLLGQFKHLTSAQQLSLDRMDWWRFLVNNGIPDDDLFLRELFDSTDFGESIRHVSAFAAMSEYADSSPNNEMDYKMKGGNATLAHKIMEHIGPEKIKLGRHVADIHQQNGKVKVTCENGEVYEGDRLICSIPTFALSKIKWTPALPEAKVSAINGLQYARINKHAVQFGQRFWPREDFDIITDAPAHYMYHATKNQPGASGALISYSTGDKADLFALSSSQVHQKMIFEALQPLGEAATFYQKSVNYYWGSDAYSRGSYAVYGKGQWFTLRKILSEPFQNIHFAGEHIADWQGFMEGAVATGAAAAEAALA